MLNFKFNQALITQFCNRFSLQFVSCLILLFGLNTFAIADDNNEQESRPKSKWVSTFSAPPNKKTYLDHHLLPQTSTIKQLETSFTSALAAILYE